MDTKLYRAATMTGLAGLAFVVAGLLILVVSAATQAFDTSWCAVAIVPSAICGLAMLAMFAIDVATGSR